CGCACIPHAYAQIRRRMQATLQTDTKSFIDASSSRICEPTEHKRYTLSQALRWPLLFSAEIKGEHDEAIPESAAACSAVPCDRCDDSGGLATPASADRCGTARSHDSSTRA